jgi:integrase
VATIIKRGKAFRAQIRRSGFPTESATFDTQREAKAWARKRESELDGTTSKRVRAAHGRKVRHALNLYARERCGFKMQFTVDGIDHDLSPRDALKRLDTVGDNVQPNSTPAKTARGIVTYLQFWFDQIGDTDLAKLDADDIMAALETIEHLSPKSQDDYQRNLQAALRFAVEPPYQWIRVNPAAFRKKGGYRERDRVLSFEEEQALITALADNNRLRLIVRVGLATGLRLGNVLGLTWSNIDLKTGEAFIPETKNGSAITTRITGDALNELKAWAKVRQIGSDYVFPAARGFSHVSFPKGEWQAALTAAGIQREENRKADPHRDPRAYWGFRFHDLRHTLATHLADVGASQFQISAVLGHKTAQQTKRYVRDSVTQIDNAFARLEGES